MKAILFDFGGTIDTDGIHWSEYFWDAYRQLNVPVTRKLFDEAYRASERQLPGTLLKRTDNFSTTVKMQTHGQIDYLRGAGYHFEPTLSDRLARHCIAGVVAVVNEQLPFLKRIAQRYALGIVSNYYGNLDSSLTELGLAPVFRVVIDSTAAGVQKPDPEIFRRALDALHTQPEETYVVGDSYERDIVPAKHLGCVTIWLRGRSWKEEVTTSEADYIISALHELSPLLRIS